MSLIRLHSIVGHTHQVRRVVRSISTLVRNIVASLILHVRILFSHVISVMGIVLRMLLTINECYPVDVVILMMVILVSSHNQFFFSSFQPYRTYRFRTITWDIHVRHVLVGVLMASLSLFSAHRRKHASVDLGRVIHVVHVLILVILSISLVNWWLPFHSSMVLRN